MLEMFNDINFFVLQDTVATMSINQNVINAKKYSLKNTIMKLAQRNKDVVPSFLFCLCLELSTMFPQK